MNKFIQAIKYLDLPSIKALHAQYETIIRQKTHFFHPKNAFFRLFLIANYQCVPFVPLLKWDSGTRA
jgi:hypothetical protein